MVSKYLLQIQKDSFFIASYVNELIVKSNLVLSETPYAVANLRVIQSNELLSILDKNFSQSIFVSAYKETGFNLLSSVAK